MTMLPFDPLKYKTYFQTFLLINHLLFYKEKAIPGSLCKYFNLFLFYITYVLFILQILTVGPGPGEGCGGR